MELKRRREIFILSSLASLEVVRNPLVEVKVLREGSYVNNGDGQLGGKLRDRCISSMGLQDYCLRDLVLSCVLETECVLSFETVLSYVALFPS